MPKVAKKNNRSQDVKVKSLGPIKRLFNGPPSDYSFYNVRSLYNFDNINRFRPSHCLPLNTNQVNPEKIDSPAAFGRGTSRPPWIKFTYRLEISIVRIERKVPPLTSLDCTGHNPFYGNSLWDIRENHMLPTCAVSFTPSQQA